MDQPVPSRQRRVPMTLAEQKRQTRQALVWAALDVFSRDGYHAANLGEIARQAGYSKGAIYSNFHGKAELFLACMEWTAGLAAESDIDPLEVGHSDDIVCELYKLYKQVAPEVSEDEIVQAVEGFSLATLEFIASAARDQRHLDELRKHVQRAVDIYAGAAGPRLAAEDELSAEEVGHLMTALDQGFGLFQILGVQLADASLIRAGLLRLVGDSGAGRRGLGPDGQQGGGEQSGGKDAGDGCTDGRRGDDLRSGAPGEGEN